MCEVTDGLINKGVQKEHRRMQPLVDAAEARAKKAEAKVTALEKRVAELEQQLSARKM